jgi:hypothetical protein
VSGLFGLLAGNSALGSAFVNHLAVAVGREHHFGNFSPSVNLGS